MDTIRSSELTLASVTRVCSLTSDFIAGMAGWVNKAYADRTFSTCARPANHASKKCDKKRDKNVTSGRKKNVTKM